MRAPTTKGLKSSMEARYVVSSPEGMELVRTHDAAWHRLLELPTPATAKLDGFVRADA